MASLFYQVFNNNVKLDEKNIKIFMKEIEKLFQKFKVDNDFDNLKVLKNKLEHLLYEETKNLSKKEKKNYKNIDDYVEKIDEILEKEWEKCKKVKLIDVVEEEVEKHYKKCHQIKPEKRKNYSKVCVKTKKINYEKELIELQVELLKLQNYIKDNKQRLLIIFEWRDAAWKGWTIKRFREYLNPRWARVVALEKPTEREQTEWYFQRYINHLPAGWEMVFFDRSWYNRAWVEPVMWFVTKEKYDQFLEDVPKFEKMLVESGIKIVKFYFSVWKEVQAERFESRKYNPLKQYKLSPVDQFSQKFWDKYSVAEYNNFKNTHQKEAPWIIINSNDKKKARINAIKYVLNQFDYPEKRKELLKQNKNIVIGVRSRLKELRKEIDIDTDLFED